MKKFRNLGLIILMILGLTGCTKPAILSIDDNSPIVEDINDFDSEKMVDELIEINKGNYFIEKSSKSDYSLSSIEKDKVESKLEKYETIYDEVENVSSNTSQNIINTIKTFKEYENVLDLEFEVYKDYLNKNLKLVSDLGLKGDFNFKIFYNQSFKYDDEIYVPIIQYVEVNNVDDNKGHVIDNLVNNNEEFYEAPQFVRLDKFKDNYETYDAYDKEIYTNQLKNAYNRYVDAKGKNLIVVKDFVTFSEDGIVNIPNLMGNTDRNTRLTMTEKGVENYNISNWSFKYVFDNFASGLIKEDEFVDMTKDMTRKDFVKPIVRLYEKKFGTIDVTGSPFTDTDDVYVKKAYYAGLVNGVGDNKFAPNNVLNREQSATIASRLLNLTHNGDVSNEPFDYNKSQYNRYNDHYNIPNWALEHVKYLNVKEIMIGYDNKFNGKDKLTIEQGLTVISRIKNYVK